MSLQKTWRRRYATTLLMVRLQEILGFFYPTTSSYLSPNTLVLPIPNIPFYLSPNTP